MDDLRQSVRNAQYEQKDPLLIYKFEGFEMFKRFIGKVNEETISFLMKAEIPVEQADDVQAAHDKKRTARNYKEQKDESRSALASPSGGNRPPVQQQTASRFNHRKIASRNQRVNVQYADGSVKKDVKFKTVEDDIKNNRCVLDRLIVLLILVEHVKLQHSSSSPSSYSEDLSIHRPVIRLQMVRKCHILF